MGKCSYVAQKLAATLVSFGLTAAYVDPCAALHGDLGTSQVGDVMLLFSKSGSTDELLKLVPHLQVSTISQQLHQKRTPYCFPLYCTFPQARSVKLIGITCMQGSPLERACDLHVHLPLQRELCQFNLAPLTSPTLQMLFGDTLAAAIVQVCAGCMPPPPAAMDTRPQARGIDRHTYGANHPSGRIGRRLTLTVASVMLTGSAMPQVTPGTTVGEALVELTRKGRGCVLVTHGGSTLHGIFTDGDLRRALQSHGGRLTDMVIDEVMTRTPRTCGATMLAVDALQVCCMERVDDVWHMCNNPGDGACSQGGCAAGDRWRGASGRACGPPLSSQCRFMIAAYIYHHRIHRLLLL